MKNYSKQDLMNIALEVQKKCSVYPKVGAVIAENGVLLSTGYKGEVESLHAERIAIEKLKGQELSNATLFTTLEPCIKIHDSQVKSCSDLIIASGFTEVVIGVLDPNGSIYSEGYGKLLENKITVNFFSKKLRKKLEEETFGYGKFESLIGSGKRRVPVVHGGTKLVVQFSETDTRTIDIRWSKIQLAHGIVDLYAANDAIRVASGAKNFSDIADPMVFRFPSHFSRMSKGMISVVQPPHATFCVLVKLIEIYDKDIVFQWEIRNTI